MIWCRIAPERPLPATLRHRRSRSMRTGVSRSM
jgi:hypothetical protein